MEPSLDPEILSGFVDEAISYLPGIRDGLRRYVSEPTPAVLEDATRFAHTIKGAASMVGLNDLSHVAFHIEELLDALAAGHIDATPDRVAAIEQAVDRVDLYLTGRRSGDTNGQLLHDAVGLLTVMAANSSSPTIPPEPVHTADEGVPGDPPPVAPFASHDGLPDFPESADVDTDVESSFTLPALPSADFVAPPRVVAASDGMSQELMEVFRLEAEDHLRVLTTLLPEAKSGTTPADRWQEIRRAAHTLKGAAAMVGFADVTALAHRMEDILDLYFEGKRTANPEEIDLLLTATDAIEDAVSGRGNPASYTALFARFDLLLAVPVEPTTDDAPETDEPIVVAAQAVGRVDTALSVRVPIDRLADVSKLTGEQVIARTALEQRMTAFARLLNELQASTSRLRRASTRLETGFEAAALVGGRFATAATGWTTDTGFDELEFDRYTEFHLISRELVETATDLQTLSDELGHVFTDFDGFLTRQARLASETEDRLTRLRMVPLSSIATKLHRTVRNAATETRKSAQFVLDGERTGLDKSVLDAMADALLHLLRNAVDHGLETTEVRTALGKPATGTVRLRAEHVGSQVVLTIEDDGRGIDSDVVREAAVRRGLVAEDAAARLTPEQLFEFLFVPGFSTKGEVTALSGRGVGLDVVKSKVESLKGTVTVTSRSGAGTTFIVRLPLTLAVVRALIVRANHESFAVPLDAVEQILRLDEADVERVGHESVLRVGGQIYPIIRLGDRLGLTRPADDVPRPPVVLIRAGGRRVALVTDALLGGREVVVKQVGPQVRRCPAVAGATLTGDGGVVLILNPAELVRPTGSARPVASSPTRPSTDSGRRGVSVLIVDDSPSVRRVLTNLAQRAGWTATTAKDGMEALELLQRGAAHPDVVLTDVEMPRMDGYELLATLRGQAATHHLPVVVITSRAADKHRKKAMDLGASAYVVKPYQDDTLIEIIRRITRTRQTAPAAVGQA